jgi:hypothetical protein
MHSALVVAAFFVMILAPCVFASRKSADNAE